MQANKLIKIWGLALVLMFATGLSLYWNEKELRQNLLGNLVFATAEGNALNVASIAMGDDVTTYNDDGMWRVSQADNYYAAFKLLRTLLDNIAAARLGGKRTEPLPADTEWTTLTVTDSEQKQYKVQISNAHKMGIHYVRYPQDSAVYRSNWKVQLPQDLVSWTRQPLLEFNGVDINRLSVGRDTIYRNQDGAPFQEQQTGHTYRRYDYFQLFDTLNDLRYDKVLSSQEFDVASFANTRTIEFTTFEGLVCRLVIYTDFNEYWASVKISTTNLPSNAVRDYIASNTMFYDDWWFRLPSATGRMLFMFKL